MLGGFLRASEGLVGGEGSSSGSGREGMIAESLLGGGGDDDFLLPPTKSLHQLPSSSGRPQASQIGEVTRLRSTGRRTMTEEEMEAVATLSNSVSMRRKKGRQAIARQAVAASLSRRTPSNGSHHAFDYEPVGSDHQVVELRASTGSASSPVAAGGRKFKNSSGSSSMALLAPAREGSRSLETLHLHEYPCQTTQQNLKHEPHFHNHRTPPPATTSSTNAVSVAAVGDQSVSCGSMAAAVQQFSRPPLWRAEVAHGVSATDALSPKVGPAASPPSGDVARGLRNRSDSASSFEDAKAVVRGAAGNSRWSAGGNRSSGQGEEQGRSTLASTTAQRREATDVSVGSGGSILWRADSLAGAMLSAGSGGGGGKLNDRTTSVITPTTCGEEDQIPSPREGERHEGQAGGASYFAAGGDRRMDDMTLAGNGLGSRQFSETSSHGAQRGKEVELENRGEGRERDRENRHRDRGGERSSRRSGHTPPAVQDDEDEEEEEDGEPLGFFGVLKSQPFLTALLAFIPFAFAAFWMGLKDEWVFLLNFIAIVPQAWLMGKATEDLSAHLGQITGGLLNAWFGNVVEMLLCIAGLRRGELVVVRSTLIGSILSNLLLVTGCSFLLGGMRHKVQEFSAIGASTNASLMTLSCMCLGLPTIYATILSSATASELQISRTVSFFLVFIYIQYLIFQLGTHSFLFADDDDEQSDMSLWMAAGVLLMCSVCCSFCSDYLVASIGGVVEQFNLSKEFIGIILLPIVGNAAEHYTSVIVAMRNKMDLSLACAVGSSCQMALFVTPLTVIVGWILDQPMTLDLHAFELLVLVMSVLIITSILQDGYSHWLEGSMLVSAYCVIAIIYFFEDPQYSEII